MNFKSQSNNLTIDNGTCVFNGISSSYTGTVHETQGRITFGDYEAKYHDNTLNLYLHSQLIDTLLKKEMTLLSKKSNGQRYTITKGKYIVFNKEASKIVTHDGIEYDVFGIEKTACHDVYKTSYKDLKIPFVSGKPIMWGNTVIFI